MKVWNASGVIYQPYAFKDFPTAKALELLNKIEATIKDPYGKFFMAANIKDIIAKSGPIGSKV